jgi:multisubunit Na+/H+ antiporter MnhC subunit
MMTATGRSEEAMPIIDALIVTAIVVAFVIFGAVLGWAEYRTRNLPQPAPQNGAKTKPELRLSTVH